MEPTKIKEYADGWITERAALKYSTPVHGGPRGPGLPPRCLSVSPCHLVR